LLRPRTGARRERRTQREERRAAGHVGQTIVFCRLSAGFGRHRGATFRILSGSWDGIGRDSSIGFARLTYDESACTGETQAERTNRSNAIESSCVLESVNVKQTGALLVLQSGGRRGGRFDPITCQRTAPAATFRVHLCGLRCCVQYPSR